MRQLIRDTIVAIAGGAIFFLTVSVATTVKPLEVVIATLGLCIIALVCLQVPGLIHRRRTASRAKLVAEIKEAVVAELSELAPEQRAKSASIILSSAEAAGKAKELKALCDI